MSAKKQIATYDETSITSLKGEERVRKRPAVIFGSDGIEGCEHSVFEIISNSVDEAKEGYGDVITVTVWKDMTIEVADKGRGVPLDYNEKEKRYNWELVYCELYAGGKYDNNSDGANYSYSLGLNGLGACSTQYSSEFMNVRSYKNGFLYEINFKKGKPVKPRGGDVLSKTPLDGKEKNITGTVTKWRPDLEVFTDINIPKEYFEQTLKRQSVVNAGTKFILKWETERGFETSEYFYRNGIEDYLREAVGEKGITMPVFWTSEAVGRDREDKNDYKFKCDIVFCASNEVNMIEYYHNSSFLEYGGSPDKAVKTAFTFAIDKYLRENGKYNKTEAKITFPDVQDVMVLVSNSFSTETSYENQTKKSINNTFIAKYMTDFIKKSLEIYFIENPLDAEKICAQVLTNKRARENAESTRLKVKSQLTGKIDIANRVEKFINCRSRDTARRELYIVEGDSAATSCKLSREADFQAIMPVRGKTLNCLTNSYDRIFKSDIIVDLLRVIGCGVELKGKVKSDLPPFDINNLPWSKVIICTDADEDGYHIRTLLLTLFYRLLPTLIKEGKVFIVESPLFEINCKDETYFAYTEAEKSEILKKFDGKKYTIQRSKGLGENTAEMMSSTTMNPASRRLIQVSPANEEETMFMFDIMLGGNIDGRKEFITEHGAEYVAAADF
ncbi:MAG: DNA topoisomerase [Clostridia bacterium]|nr:DNA topoisomerase [Clostridia bacterium]